MQSLIICLVVTQGPNDYILFYFMRKLKKEAIIKIGNHKYNSKKKKLINLVILRNHETILIPLAVMMAQIFMLV